MKKRFFILIVTSMTVVTLIYAGFFRPSPARAEHGVQISGIGRYADPGECEELEGAGADYILILDGDLVGCVYTYVTGIVSSPVGPYRELGTELYVVNYNGKVGSFETIYQFEAKYSDVGEIFGRCQHPIVSGSGTGDFKGVTGRIDFKDDIEQGNFPYRGHLSYP